MSILQYTPVLAGQTALNSKIVYITTNSTYNQVISAGFIDPSVYVVNESNLYLVSYGANSDSVGLFTASISNNVVTLSPYFAQGNVTLPVVNNDFANFDGTTGKIKDSGYSPSNAAKTKIVMANSAMVSGNMPSYTDTVGTVGDSGIATNRVFYGSLTTPDVGANLIYFSTAVPRASLASNGTVTLFTASSASARYVVLDLRMDGSFAPWTGGNRNLVIQDTVGLSFSTIPSASLLSPANAGWGSTALPYGNAALSQATNIGANIIAQYSGGTTDYTGGVSYTISGLLVRTA